MRPSGWMRRRTRQNRESVRFERSMSLRIPTVTYFLVRVVLTAHSICQARLPCRWAFTVPGRSFPVLWPRPLFSGSPTVLSSVPSVNAVRLRCLYTPGIPVIAHMFVLVVLLLLAFLNPASPSRRLCLSTRLYHSVDKHAANSFSIIGSGRPMADRCSVPWQDGRKFLSAAALRSRADWFVAKLRVG